MSDNKKSNIQCAEQGCELETKPVKIIGKGMFWRCAADHVRRDRIVKDRIVAPK